MVMIQTNGTAINEMTPNAPAVERQPISGIRPAASGSARATPMPGPA